LFFYSEKIIFNAHYRAARSDSLQSCLRENDLSLVNVEILLEHRIVYLALEGPNPPVRIKSLFEDLVREAELEDDDSNPFTLEYTWTQKVSGAWPTASEQITAVADSDRLQTQLLMKQGWEWEFTQYDANRGSRPGKTDTYIVQFEDRNNLMVSADCGKKKGKYNVRGKSMSIEMKRLNWFRCRDDEEFQVFLGDLQRSLEFFIEDGQLKIALATNSGIMYFKKR
jgi:hypothetical protein